MSDRDRVNLMVEEGKITPEEAERLLSALEDIGGLEGEMDDLEREAAQEDGGGTSAGVPIGSASSAAEAVPASSPQDLRWVRVSILAGDLDIRGDASLSEPLIDSDQDNVTLSREGNDFVIALAKREKTARREGVDGFLDGIGEFVSGIVGRIGDLDIRVPAGFGVMIDSKAGDVDVRGVAFVKAKLLAGDIDLHDIGGIDLSMSAGDVDATLLLTKGQHRVKVSAGDVDVRLLSGSSVTVAGSVSMGDIEAEKPLEAFRTGMGGNLSGRLGAGEAKLELSVSAGDLEVGHA